MFKKALFALCLCSLTLSPLRAEEPVPAQPAQSGGTQRAELGARNVLTATKDGLESLFDKGFSFLGIRYKRGGDGPEEGGFDCSGLVRKVFSDAIGLSLPRTAAEMAKVGEKVSKDDLKPGDLVFFNTMRRAFSHVGIYLGENRFMHAPSTGKDVRVEKMDSSYWTKRFNGARRLLPEAQASELSPAAQQPAQAQNSR